MPYISKKNKISQLKFTTEHVIWTEGQWDGFITAINQTLTRSIVMGESTFDAVLRNDIHLSGLKVALNLEEEV